MRVRCGNVDLPRLTCVFAIMPYENTVRYGIF